MKHWHYFLCAAVVLAVALSFNFSGVPKDQTPQLNDSQPPGQTIEETSSKQWEMKTDEQSQVVVQVAPIELGKDAKTWKFAIILDTHSGSLDEDMVKASFLSDEQGNIYQPIAWEGSPPGGHHREGVLVFNTIEPMPLSIELKIKGVDGVEESSFKWELK